MSSRGWRWVILSVCLLLSIFVTYVALVLAWRPEPISVLGILPGAYIGTVLNKLLRLPVEGAGPFVLVLGGSVLFWFMFFLGVAWVLLRVRSRWGRTNRNSN